MTASVRIVHDTLAGRVTAVRTRNEREASALAEHPSVVVREAVACNEGVRSMLLHLARDGASEVRLALVGRCELPDDVSELLAEDADEAVREALLARGVRGELECAALRAAERGGTTLRTLVRRLASP